MRLPLRLLVSTIVLAVAVFLPHRATAGGIYCSSYEQVGPKYGIMVCRTTCVYCVDEDNNDNLVGLDCYDNSCWFGKPAN
jgi:hypothetical protein